MRNLYFFLLLSFIWSCKSSTDMPVPAIKEELQIIPVEEILFNLDTTQLIQSIDSMYQKYPGFSDLYFQQILPIKQTQSREDMAVELNKFLRDPNILWLKDTVQLILPNLNLVKEEIEHAFAWYTYYFPDQEVPDIYTFISAFQFQRFLFEDENSRDAIGLGMDFFLGENFPYQQMVPNNPNFSKFLSWTFDQRFIPKKITELLIDDLMGDVNGTRLIDYMIHNGKKWHILSQILPKEEKSIITELTDDQLSWCSENELEIWSFFLDEKLFYETNYMKISKLIQPSPVAPAGMPSDAPGQTANFIGWKIVQTFMNRYPETSLTDLIKLKDAQTFLDQSRYKPQKR